MTTWLAQCLARLQPLSRRLRGPLSAFCALALVTASCLIAVAPLAQAQETIATAELDKVRAVESSRIAAIQKVYHTVVAVYGMNRQGGGSGVVFSPEGYVLTNHHVVAGAGQEGWGGLADGKLYKWKLYGTDPGGDLAIIKLEGPTKDHRFQYSRLADSDTVRVGDFAMAMGNPFILAEDQTPTVTLGVVSGVKRYQPGAGPGGKMLEYGNCIQIDSSINPGNSGGPLFNMNGEVIGINGRGSFEERGRVNVGLGYAISSNQCKMFIPELLATKVCEHGTLEAVFARRGNNEVICESINLDAPIGKAGMELADRLVKFNGQEIRNTHEFTSLIATLPAHWPVEVVWEHEGKQKSAWVRLTAIAYPKPPAPPRGQPAPAPKEKDKEKKDEKHEEKGAKDAKAQATPAEAPKDAAPKPTEAKNENDKNTPKPASPEAPSKETPKPPTPPKPPQPAPQPIQMPGPQMALNFGQIRDAKINEQEALRVLAQWVEFQGGRAALDKVKAVRLTEEWTAGGAPMGKSKIISAADGRVRVEGVGHPLLFVWDGSVMYEMIGDQKNRHEGDAAKKHRMAALRTAVAGYSAVNPKDHFKRIVLQGVDKAQGRIAYRILTEDQAGNRMVGWFSMLRSDHGSADFETQLLKFGMADDKDQPTEDALAIDGYRELSGIKVPTGVRMVRGLAETPAMVGAWSDVEVLTEVPADAFAVPK